MKLPVSASDLHGLVVALHALTTPGMGPTMAIAPLLGFAGGVLGLIRKMLP